MKTNELREKYLKFFEKHGHKIVPSSSLLPENDPTTLFTSAGMQPMIPYLLGQSHPLGTRLTDSQKCFRTQDIDEIGDNRHTTFFEMLGNWSFGDYFKQEQITWFFEFLTEDIGLNPHNLYVTVFKGSEENGIPKDEEAAQIWQELFNKKGVDNKVVENSENGMQEGRIFYYDAKKNWWSRAGVPEKMPVGEPGGPDTEVFWDFGAELGLHENSAWKNEPCHPNCDCGRFMEIGNNVFMEYIKTENGFELLKQKNVDFGGGLERILAAQNNNPDVFRIDVFNKMIEKLEELSGKKYTENTQSFRVILDHLRAATFLIGDGAVPNNKDQGYFTRRLIRRAIRFAYNLNIHSNFCGKLAQIVIENYQETYTDLAKNQDKILEELQKEEEKFRKTLEKGIKHFEQIENNNISGVEAFDLYQTYGFPIEMTLELATEKGKTVDLGGFNQELKKHQDLSRQGAEQKFKGGLADTSEMSVKYHTATHLLHAALRKVLGDHVEQKGSNITPERLRFDFSHPEKLSDEEIKKVEDLVNSAIKHNYPVTFEEIPLEEAREKGAIGLFGDKYGEKVKVYTVGDPNGTPNASEDSETFSMEMCGGPHVEHTGSMGTFKIQKQESIGGGLCRIKAVL